MFLQHGLYLVFVFEEGAATRVFPPEGTGIAYATEKRRLKGCLETYLGDVAVGIGRERARLGGTIGTYVKESTARRQTPAKGFLVARERE